MGKKKQTKLFKSLLRFQGLISGPRNNLALDTLDTKLNTVGYAYLALCFRLPLVCL